MSNVIKLLEHTITITLTEADGTVHCQRLPPGVRIAHFSLDKKIDNDERPSENVVPIKEFRRDS